jgi:orotate phosphoribosyltransferase
MDHLRERGAEVLAGAFLIDRSAGKASFDAPFTALAAVDMESFAPEACPLCAEGIPVTEPDDIVL